MATSNSSGKNSFSENDAPWEAFENGRTAWTAFRPADQERIIRHYAPKIKYIASRLKFKLPKAVELNELVSAGTLGLLEALGKFQPGLNIKFDTYSENRIRGAMLDELRRVDWLPRSLRQRVRSIDAAMQRMNSETNEAVTEERLSEETGLPVKEVRETLEAMQNQLCLSLENLQEAFAFDAKAPDDNEPYHTVADKDLMEKLAALIGQLTPREKLVLSLYYTDELTMRETAEVMGITEGRVSQLHTQAIARLKNGFAARYGAAEA